MNNNKKNLKKSISTEISLQLIFSVSLLGLAFFLCRLKSYGVWLGIPIALPAIIIIAQQIIKLKIEVSRSISNELSRDRIVAFFNTHKNKFIFLVVGTITIILVLMRLSDFFSELERSSENTRRIVVIQEELNRESYKHTHNTIPDKDKQIYLSYLKAHPEDIADAISGHSIGIEGISSLDTASGVPFSFISLDTVTKFNIPKQLDEFAYQDYLTNELPKVAFYSRQIVNKEISESPASYHQDVSLTVWTQAYNFENKSFHFSSLSVDENINFFPLACLASTKNVSISDSGIILNDAKKASLYYFKYLSGKSLGEICYNPNMLELIDAGILNARVSSYSYSEKVEEGSAHIIMGFALPTIVLDLTNFYIFIDHLRDGGVYAPHDKQARKISSSIYEKIDYSYLSLKSNFFHKISGVISVDFSPSKDCKVLHVCKRGSRESQDLRFVSLNLRESYIDCSDKQVLLCKPEFSNFRILN